MTLDEEAMEGFSLFSEEELDELSDDTKNLQNVFSKYKIDDIDIEVAKLNLVTYIENLYFYEKDIPEDIKDIIKYNVTFKKFLLNKINERLDNISKDSSIVFFVELSNLLNLLSLGEKFDILSDYNNYNLDNLSNLFRTYESFLSDVDDARLFDITFLHYIKVIELFHKLCIVNSTDIQRKKTILPILDILTETNNMIKFQILLPEDKIFVLNNILGKQLYYYTHIGYVDTSGMSIDEIFNKYESLINKIIDGYELSKETNFGNMDNPENESIIYKSNIAFLLLNLITKLKYQYNIKNITNYPKLIELVSIYDSNYFNPNLSNDVTIDGIMKFLINAFSIRYAKVLELNENISYKAVISHFCSLDSNFNPIILEYIHNILLFAIDIEKLEYIQLAEVLLSIDKIPNDIYEFYKLKTLDIIITKITYLFDDNFTELIDNILKYINSNKIASNLMSAFSKLYLSIAIYYSYKTDDISFNKSRELYYIFVNTDGFNLLDGVYNNLFNKLLLNFGKTYSSILGLDDVNLIDTHYKNMSKRLVSEYVKFKDIEMKYKIDTEISHLVNEVLNTDGLGDKIINDKISSFISNDLFYGLCSVYIEGLSNQKRDIFYLKRNGLDLYTLKLVDNFSIVFIYPKIYKSTFEYIFNANKMYIEENIQNILLSYIKNRTLYIDKVTGLDNFNKLSKDIQRIPKDKVIMFFEINVVTLEEISKNFSYKQGNNYLKIVVTKLKEIVKGHGKVYRLSGLKIGILVFDYFELVQETLLSFLSNLNIKVDNKNIKSRFNIGLVKSYPDGILNKSSQALQWAIKNNKFIAKIDDV